MGLYNMSCGIICFKQTANVQFHDNQLSINEFNLNHYILGVVFG